MTFCRELDLAVIAGLCITAQEGTIDVMMLQYHIPDDLSGSTVKTTRSLGIGPASTFRIKVAFIFHYSTARESGGNAIQASTQEYTSTSAAVR